MAKYYSIVYMYHIFIHSSADGHFGRFHLLATVNSTAMNIGVHACFWINGFLQVYAQEWDFQVLW